MHPVFACQMLAGTRLLAHLLVIALVIVTVGGEEHVIGSGMRQRRERIVGVMTMVMMIGR